MQKKILEALLKGRLPNPDGPGMLSVDTKCVFIGTGGVLQASRLLKEAGLGGKRLFLVADQTTYGVLGQALEQALEKTFETDLFLLDKAEADEKTVSYVMAAAGASGAGVLVAVGSGTLNDITKLAACRLRLPYFVFGTAPSMNGYVSKNASIKVDGYKKTLAAVAPVGAVLDLAVLCQAPKRLILSGFGDSLCRPTAQADWLLSHFVRRTSYLKAPFLLLAPFEQDLFAKAPDLTSGRLTEAGYEAMSLLAHTLILSGFGMALAGDSSPASGSEHALAHYLEKHALQKGAFFHGEVVGVMSLLISRLQAALLQQEEAPVLFSDSVTEEELIKRFGPATGAEYFKNFAAKREDEAGAEAAFARLKEDWPDIRVEIGKILPSPRFLTETAIKARMMRRFQDLLLTADETADALFYAPFIRPRYGFTDLARRSRVNFKTFLKDD